LVINERGAINVPPSLYLLQVVFFGSRISLFAMLCLARSVFLCPSPRTSRCFCVIVYVCCSYLRLGSFFIVDCQLLHFVVYFSCFNLFVSFPLLSPSHFFFDLGILSLTSFVAHGRTFLTTRSVSRCRKKLTFPCNH